MNESIPHGCKPVAKSLFIDHFRGEVALKHSTFDELTGALVSVVLYFPANMISNEFGAGEYLCEALVLEEMD